MNRFQQRAAQVPRAVTWLIVSPLIALAGYWWFTYTGLYRLLAEWQLHRFQSYYPKYTGFAVVIICLVPAVIAIQVIGGLREAERSAGEAAAQAASNAERSQRVSSWIQRRHRRLLGLVVTGMLAGMGVYFTGLGLLAGDRVPVDAGAIERGEGPRGRWVELSGQIVGDDAVTVSEQGRSSSAKVYIPMVSPEWRPGQPVRLYLQARESLLDRPDADLVSGHYEGMLSANSLPGVAITSFSERGHPAPDHYWVLDYRKTPKMQTDLGYTMFAGAAIVGFVTALGWTIAARRERAAARPSP